MRAFIVWNSDKRTEGVVFTGDEAEQDAKEASTGRHGNPSSSLAAEFFNLYEDLAPLPIQEVDLP